MTGVRDTFHQEELASVLGQPLGRNLLCVGKEYQQHNVEHCSYPGVLLPFLEDQSLLDNREVLGDAEVQIDKDLGMLSRQTVVVSLLTDREES